MFLTTIKGQSEGPLFREWKASSKGQRRNLEATLCRDARVMMPWAPSSLRICVHARSADLQKSPHTEGMLRPTSSTGAWSPALGNEAGRLQIFLESVSRTESTSFMA